MNDFDIMLRGVLTDLASAAPSPDGLVGAVHDRDHRLRRRRLAVVAVGATLAVTLVGAGAVTLGHRSAENSVQTIQVATPAGDRQKPAPSPVDVGWLPAGFGKSQLIMLGPGAWGIDARRGGDTQLAKGFAAIEIQVMAGKPIERKAPGTLTKIDVGGASGSLYWVPAHAPGIDQYGHTPPEAEGPYAELIYQRKPGQWIRIIAQNSAGDIDMGLTPADLTKIATSLVDRERPLPDVLRLALLPGNVEWGRVTNEDYGVYALFTPAATKPRAVGQEDMPNGHNGSVTGPVSVQVLPEDSLEVQAYAPSVSKAATANSVATVEPSPPPIAADGTVYRQDGSTAVLYRLRSNPKLVVIVREKDSFGMSDADLRKVAASVRLGRDAAVVAR